MTYVVIPLTRDEFLALEAHLESLIAGHRKTIDKLMGMEHYDDYAYIKKQVQYNKHAIGALKDAIHSAKQRARIEKNVNRPSV
jgi:hypothetical protein